MSYTLILTNLRRASGRGYCLKYGEVYNVWMYLGISRKFLIPFALVWLTGLLLFALPFSVTQPSEEGLVYCPLQKKWVDPNPPKIAPPPSPLDEICAASKKKAEFSGQLLSALSTAFRQYSRTDITDLYFAYAKEGKTAFSRFGSPPNSPELPGNIFASRDSVSSSSQRNILPVATPVAVGFDSYKNTLFAAENPYFEREEFEIPTSISRSLQPRAPPFS